MAWAVFMAQAGQQSKLGIHINHITEGERMIEFVAIAKPRAIIILHHDPNFIARIREVSPNTKIIFRYFVEDSEMDYQMARGAEKAAEWYIQDHIMRKEPNKYDFVVGFNERARNSDDSWRFIGRFDSRAADLCHGYGFPYMGGSHGVGHPAGTLEEMERRILLPEVREGWSKVDAIAAHCYCAPTVLDPRNWVEGSDPTKRQGWFVFRFRIWYPWLPPECQKPLYLTEFGIDSGAAHWDPGAQGGWRSFCSPESYIEQCAEWDVEARKDDELEAALIYCWGTLDPTWDSFCLSGRAAELLQDYLVRNLGPTVEPPLKYHSHILLIPQEVPEAGWDATQRYVDTFRTTLSRSAHDAVSMRGGLSHTVSVALPTGALMEFLHQEQQRESFILDVVEGTEWSAVKAVLDGRAQSGVKVP
jgi:hypothetical protein